MDDLNIYIVTFNCGRELVEPDPFSQHLLDGWQDPTSQDSDLPDVIVLNLQEFAPISYAFIGGNLAKPYFDRFRRAVPKALQQYADKQSVDAEEFTNVISRNNGLTALMIFARKSLVSAISSINIAEVGVGVAEMGNKGAVGARIGWDVHGNGQPLYTTFVSAHLAPFEAEVQRRDQDYVNIVKGLAFSSKDAREWRKEQTSDENVPLLAEEASESEGALSTGLRGIYCNDSYLFFSGDLNYRTALTGPGREDSASFPQPRKDPNSALHYKQLLDKDQLQQQLKQGKTLHGLTEQSINFPPTYKYHIDSDKPVIQDSDVEEWNWAEHRWPSWCDRILFSRTDSLPVKAGRYSALPIFRTSDHRPVALSVSVPVNSVKNSGFAGKAPAQINQHCQASREAARRKEIAVGVAAYLGLTWEGRSLLLGTILIFISGYALLKSLG